MNNDDLFYICRDYLKGALDTDFCNDCHYREDNFCSLFQMPLHNNKEGYEGELNFYKRCYLCVKIFRINWKMTKEEIEKILNWNRKEV